MADRYSSFEELSEAETEGRDFAVRCANRGSRVLVLAPHGGGIEPGTSELAISISGPELSYYVFDGLKPQGNGELHITSTNFDEPKALELAAASEFVLSVHGEGSDEEVVYMGGLDNLLKPQVKRALYEAGFATGEKPGIMAHDPSNICNRCTSGAGLQLELTRGLRARFFQSLSASGRRNTTDDFELFCEAVRVGIQNAGAF